MEFLQVPLAVDQFRGEVVEQFRVSGQLSTDAEVLGGAHEADTEVLLPDSVDQHASG